MIAAVGETVSFHADLAKFAQAKPALEWKVAGAEIVEKNGVQIRIELPVEPDFVTISASVKDVTGQRIGFGSHGNPKLCQPRTITTGR